MDVDVRVAGSCTAFGIASFLRAAGLGKASLYHYFKTKEEVFIWLYLAELDSWLPDVAKRLNRLRTPTPERIAKALTDALRD